MTSRSKRARRRQGTSASNTRWHLGKKRAQEQPRHAQDALEAAERFLKDRPARGLRSRRVVEVYTERNTPTTHRCTTRDSLEDGDRTREGHPELAKVAARAPTPPTDCLVPIHPQRITQTPTAVSHRIRSCRAPPSLSRLAWPRQQLSASLYIHSYNRTTQLKMTA